MKAIDRYNYLYNNPPPLVAGIRKNPLQRIMQAHDKGAQIC